jgi:uncharacterized protein (DUF58 family)
MLLSVAVLVVALLLTSLLLARAQLSGLVGQRQLPEEIIANQPAAGRFLLINRRQRLGAWNVTVREDGPVPAGGTLDRLPPGSRRTLSVRWWFSERGVVGLRQVRLSSRAPFGIIEGCRMLTLPAEVVVYPQPRPGGRFHKPYGSTGQDGVSSDQRQGGGALVGLRAYRPGDPLRWVHWPTSARVGHPMVVQRAAETRRLVMVDVEDATGAAWELNLSLAAGAIEHHIQSGVAVGLRLSGQRWPARSDGLWRRVLLEQLARAERR